jgi:tetratricopeptide (TPR) repeat protein
MPQPATNPKIEELRFRVKTDPKSRLFYQLAEELRKAGQHGEAEQVLRTGLSHHSTYLSAWVSLGRVLRDQQKNQEAVEALNKALQVDPGNVVAARLLADTYLALGEKVEAIKKYKLVYAQMRGDEELEAVIARLDQEIKNPAAAAAAPPPPPQPSAPPAAPPPPAPVVSDSPWAEEPPVAAAPAPIPAQPPASAPRMPSSPISPSGGQSSSEFFDITYSRLKQGVHLGESAAERDAREAMEREQRSEIETGDAEPMLASHAESPFEEPAGGSGYGADAFAIEQPGGIHIAPAPLSAEVPAPVSTEPESDSPWSDSDDSDGIYVGSGDVAPGFVTSPFASNIEPPPPDPDDFARTITMADLYANQGLVDEARDIYEDVLLRDPSNESVRAKLEALNTAPPPPPAFDEEEEPSDEPEADVFAASTEDLGEPFAPAGEIESSVSPFDTPPSSFELSQPAFGVDADDFGSAPSFESPKAIPMTAVAGSSKNPKIEKLQSWLAKVKGQEGGRV